MIEQIEEVTKKVRLVFTEPSDWIEFSRTGDKFFFRDSEHFEPTGPSTELTSQEMVELANALIHLVYRRPIEMRD